jgi:hypothetical protein
MAYYHTTFSGRIFLPVCDPERFCSRRRGRGGAGAARRLRVDARGFECAFMQVCGKRLDFAIFQPKPCQVFFLKNTLNSYNIFT